MKWGYVIGIVGAIIIAVALSIAGSAPSERSKYQTSIYVYPHYDKHGAVFYLNADQERIDAITTMLMLVGGCFAAFGCVVEIIRLKPWQNGWD